MWQAGFFIQKKPIRFSSYLPCPRVIYDGFIRIYRRHCRTKSEFRGNRVKHNCESVVCPGSCPVRELTTVKEQPAVSDIITHSGNTEGPPSVAAKPHNIALPQITNISVGVTGEVMIHLYRGKRNWNMLLCELHKKMM